MLNNRYIHFNKYSDFKKELDAGNISSTSIVFIKDTKLLFTHGLVYDCNGLSKEEVDALIDRLTSVENTLKNKANVGDSYTKAESDKKYLTEHQSLDGYVKESEFEGTLLDTFSFKEHVNNYNGLKLDVANLTGQLGNKANASSVYTKSETYSKTEVDTKLGDKANKTDISDMATQTWVEGKKYLTQHQSLTDYAKTSDVDTKIANAKSEIIGGAGSQYDTLKEIETWVKSHEDVYKGLVSTVDSKADKTTVNDLSSSLDTHKKDTTVHITAAERNNWVTLDGAQTITGAKTFGAEALVLGTGTKSHITNANWADGTLLSNGSDIKGSNKLSAIRNALKFDWYNEPWFIGNVRSGSESSLGFGIASLSDDGTYLNSNFRVTKTGSYINENLILHAGNYTSTLDPTYVKKSGDTMTGTLEVKDRLVVSADSNPKITIDYHNKASTDLKLDNSGTVHVTKYNDTNFSKYSSIKADTFIKNGGTSSQFLKADGSVDGNNYLTTSTADSNYVKKIGDTMTGQLILPTGTSINATGLRFADAVAHIGSTSTGHFGIHATGNIYLRPNCASVSSYGNGGIVFTTSNIYPESSNSVALGTANARWTNVYSVLGNFSGQITSTVATGTAPLSVVSTTLVSNLNADMLDGYHSSELFRINEQNARRDTTAIGDLTATTNDSNNYGLHYNLCLTNTDNALYFYVNGVDSKRIASIQVGHKNQNYIYAVGALHLNKLGGNVYINNVLAATVNSNVASATTATTANNLASAPSLAASGNNITVTAGGKTSSAFTVPYANNADTVDGLHSSDFTKMVSGNYDTTTILKITPNGTMGFFMNFQWMLGNGYATLLANGYGYGTSSRNHIAWIKRGSENLKAYNNGSSESCCIYVTGFEQAGNYWLVNMGGSVTVEKVTSIPSDATLMDYQYALLTSTVNKAIQLSTARKLWGQSFNGSADISGDMTGVGSITASGDNIITKSGVGNTFFRAKNDAISIDVIASDGRGGLYNRSREKWIIGVDDANTFIQCGNFGVDTDNPQYPLDVNGNSRITGGLTVRDLIVTSGIINRTDGNISIGDYSNNHYVIFESDICNRAHVNGKSDEWLISLEGSATFTSVKANWLQAPKLYSNNRAVSLEINNDEIYAVVGNHVLQILEDNYVELRSGNSLFLQSDEQLDLNGKQITASTTINVNSDARLKENVQTLPKEVLEALDKVEYKSFNYIGNSKDEYGVIAQELLPLNLPGIVSEYEYEDPEKRKEREARNRKKKEEARTLGVEVDDLEQAETETYYSVNYTNLHTLEIARLKKKVNTLEAELAELKEIVAKLYRLGNVN